MCYNIAFLEKRLANYAHRYKQLLPENWNERVPGKELPVYHFISGFAHPSLPVIKHDAILSAQWGLIPFWISNNEKATDIRSKTLNAVGETVFEKPSFRKSIRSQRCLLGVNGFFEWRSFNQKKYPYYIHPIATEIFSLGCIYDSWIDKTTGEIMDTFSILTTPANLLMEQIHNQKKRMPLIIPREKEQMWIDPELPVQKVAQLIQPFPEKGMTAYTISQKANSTRNDRNTSDITERTDYPILPEIQFNE